MQLTNSKLNNCILYSNKNVEKVCRSLINESANAVLLEVFEDKMLLADHVSGGIYFADYKFDGKTLALENFEDVEVENDNSNLREAINNYFEDGYDVASIIEAYEEDSESNDSELTESIVNALSSKNMGDLTDYTQLVGINEECEELKDMEFFKTYKEYLTESPSSSIKFIDWVNPVKVSLIDEDTNKFLTFSTKQKAEKVIKDVNFRKELKEAIKEMDEGYSDRLENLLSENYSVLSLDQSALNEAVGMSIVGDKDLMSNRKEIVEKINELVSEDEILSNYKTIFEEAEEDAEEEGKEEDKALETSDKDIEALKTALDKALEKIEDEKLKNKINDLKDALDESKSEGTTDVSTVKECVELLSL